jgi:hypothetical protein
MRARQLLVSTTGVSYYPGMDSHTPKSAEDVELARIASRERTVKFVVGCGFAAFVVWKIANTVVQLRYAPAKPAWLEVLLGVLGPGGAVTVFM